MGSDPFSFLSEARKRFAAILDRARKDGAVLVKRADGSCYRIVPELVGGSPLELPRLGIKLKRGELAAALAEIKERPGE